MGGGGGGGGLSTEGNLRFKIDWASLIVGVNLPFLLCFTLYLRVIFQVQTPGAYIWRGDLTEGFLRYRFRALIFGGAYFRNFTVFVIGCGYTPKIISYLQGKINCSTITKNDTNNLLQHSLLILRKKKQKQKKPTVLQSTKR